MPMIGSFYAPGEWVQPNQRNIGDSLLDLYKMKREIENDRMQREKAQMELENARLERATVLENAKKEREGQKIIQKALADKEVTKQGYTAPSVISGLTKGAKSLADFYGSLGTGMQFPTVPQISSALTGALGGRLPSVPIPSMQGPTTVTQPVNYRDPAVQSAFIRAATIAPSLRPVLDDLIRANAGRTTEDQLMLDENRARLAAEAKQQAVQDFMKKQEFAQNLRDGSREGERKYQDAVRQNTQEFQMRLRQFDVANRTVPIIYAEGMGWQNFPGGNVRPFMLPNQPSVQPSVQPSAGAGMTLPSGPIQSPGMASSTQTLPADYGTGPSGAVLSTDGTATGTPSVGPEPMPGVHQAKATPKVGQAKISENLQKRYDAGVKVVTSVEPQFKTMFRLLDQTEAGADPSATRAEMIKVLRAKVLDPISVVREGEVFRFESLLSMKDRGELILNQIATARDFTPEQARQVKEEMMGLYQDMKMWEAGEEAYYRQQADAMGVQFISRNGASPAVLAQPTLPAGAVLQRDKTGKTVGYRIGNQKFYMDGTPVSGGK